MKKLIGKHAKGKRQTARDAARLCRAMALCGKEAWGGDLIFGSFVSRQKK
jgi:hypothetical protein